MSLKQRIEADIKQAMLAKNKDDLRALRGIKSLILLAQTDKGAKGEISEETEMKILQKASKQRTESMELYLEQGRSDLAEIEKAELQVIKRYLPEQLSEEVLKETIREIIEGLGASSIQDMGKVMGAATKKLAGKADNKKISEIVRSILLDS
jgi:uncharacterized protein YqeY